MNAAPDAAGVSMADIVELTTFHTDLRGDMAAFSAVEDEFLPDRYPSWTALGVARSRDGRRKTVGAPIPHTAGVAS